jgi:hypothetical protein
MNESTTRYLGLDVHKETIAWLFGRFQNSISNSLWCSDTPQQRLTTTYLVRIRTFGQVRKRAS